MSITDKILAVTQPELYLAKKMLSPDQKKEESHPAAPPQAPQGSSSHGDAPSSGGSLIAVLAIGGLLIGTAFYLLGALGLRTGLNLFGILITVLLALLYKANPKVMGTIFSILGFAAFGIGGFVMLALLPGKSTYIFTTLFLVFYLILLLAVIGARALWVIAIIGIVIAISSSMYPQLYYEGSPIYNAVVGQRQSWTDLVSGTRTFVNETQKGLTRQIAIATGDQAYEDGVQAQSQKPLGVFLDNFAVTQDKVTAGQPIDAFVTLRAESFKTPTPIEIDIGCTAKAADQKEVEGEIKPTAHFTVEEYDQQSVDCLLKSSDLIKDASSFAATIKMTASFDFTTSAFLKSYFMDQETIRSYRRQQLDPLDEFKIAEKNPVAVYTGGPLKIGMGVGKQPISLVPEVDAGPTLAITFEKNWVDGRIISLKELTLIAPPGIAFSSLNLQPIDSMCTGGGDKEQTCKITSTVLKDIFTKEELLKPFTTIRVQTKLTSIDALLGQSPLAIRSFKATAKYQYQVEKTTSVTIAKEVPR